MYKYGILLSALLFSSSSMAWNCSEERTITTELDIGAVADIRVQAGAGELSIKGSDQRGKIGLVAQLCASDESVLSEMDVETEIENEYVSIETSMPKKWSGNTSMSIDLSLVVPKGSRLDVKDSSGDLEVKGVSELTLVDSSGDIKIKNIEGKVDLADSSGSIRMAGVGEAEVADSSGAIDVRDVVNDFTIKVDSSGDIEVQGVGGDVLVKVDSSGSIDVKDVAGSFTVEKDGSGGIRYDNVEGEVDIPRRKR